jgi:hypothetical protein
VRPSNQSPHASSKIFWYAPGTQVPFTQSSAAWQGSLSVQLSPRSLGIVQRFWPQAGVTQEQFAPATQDEGGLVQSPPTMVGATQIPGSGLIAAVHERPRAHAGAIVRVSWPHGSSMPGRRRQMLSPAAQ